MHTFTGPEWKRAEVFPPVRRALIERGEHIVIRHCTLTDSANGLFVASGIRKKSFHVTSWPRGPYLRQRVAGSFFQHNAYNRGGRDGVSQNWFGALRRGAGGNALKDARRGRNPLQLDRGGAHLLDLVEPEESTKITGAEDLRFRRTYVYGQVSFWRGAGRSVIVHYGGDNGNLGQLPQGGRSSSSQHRHHSR